eukprot:3234679-Pyramimonas_sp.AAC.1
MPFWFPKEGHDWDQPVLTNGIQKGPETTVQAPKLASRGFQEDPKRLPDASKDGHGSTRSGDPPLSLFPVARRHDMPPMRCREIAYRGPGE